LAALEKYESATFALVTLPDEFMIAENYLLDCVHLSEKGHRKLADLLKVTFKNLTAPIGN
jgi:lysophospholipase L1-like esterase